MAYGDHVDDSSIHLLTDHLNPKATLADQDKASREAIPDNGAAAAKLGSRLDPKTGYVEPRTSKDKTARDKQFGRVSEAYKRGYDAIQWD